MLIDELATCCCVRYWTLWIQERQNCIAITAPPIINPSVPNTPVGRIRVALERQIVNGDDRSAQHQDTMHLRAGAAALVSQHLATLRQEIIVASSDRFIKRLPFNEKGEDMSLRSQRLAEIREHIKAESSHDMKALLAGMTGDCFNDVAAVPKPFRGPKRVAERYRKHWAGFPDFRVRVKRLLAVGENTIVTENEWSGTHLGKFLGYPPTGKYVRVRALVVWHFKGRRLWGETVFFDMGRVLKKIGARVTIPRNRREAKRRD